MTALAARLDTALADVRTGRAAPRVLIALYEEAAAQADSEVQRGFFLTHAYVHALETADPRSAQIHTALKQMGREA